MGRRPVHPLSPWQQVVEYHRRAVIRGGVAEPVAAARRGAWRVLNLQSERLVTGGSDELEVDAGAASLFASLPVGESVYYGWPLVIVENRRGVQHVAPVVMTEIVRPDNASRRVLARDDQPYLNPGLFTEEFFAPEDVFGLEPLLAAPLPFGDPAALTARVTEVLRTVGLHGTVDPRALASPGPLHPGVHNRVMVFQGRSDDATRALAEELADLRDRTDWAVTAAAALLFGRQPPPPPNNGASDVGFTVGLPPLSVRSLRLNASQEQALASAASAPVTVVTGPPGTGKSQLVAGIVANQWLAGRSVLVASTNNTAVDVAVERATSIDPALLIRTGNRDHRQALTETLAPLASRPSTPHMSAEITRRRLEAAAAGRQHLADGFAVRARAEAELAQALRDIEGLRSLLWGTPTAEPQRAARRQVHALIAKCETSRWLRKRRERRILALAASTAPGVGLVDVLRWAGLDARVDQLTSYLTALGPADPDVDRAALAAADEAWAAAGNDALTAILDLSVTGAQPHVHHLRQARTQSSSGALRATITRSITDLKGWACTALTAKANFALTPGLFDLLVVDEASQCSIAQILPLAYRARRIVVVGDPNQLTPIVTLNRGHLEQIAAASATSEAAIRAGNLSALTDSAFTAYAARAPRTHLLDEHYRCHPQIAAFINTHFYGGALRVLTDVTIDQRQPRGLSFIDTPGRTERGPTSGAYNQAEVDAVVAWVLTHALDGARLGIVTPFAAHASRIRQALAAALGDEAFAAAGITIGTAHAFQGGECDVVLFSLVLAADAPLGTATWVETQRNLINVAVSRAKRALIIIGDQTALRALPVPTLHALVDAASAPARGDHTPTATELAEVTDLHSEAERRLYAALLRAGHTVRLKPVIEGYELDFAVDTDEGVVNVEVDGTQHLDDRGRQRRQDLARDAILTNLGIRVIRIPAWRCLSDANGAVAVLGR